MEYLNQTLNKFSYNLTNLHIVAGGITRNDSIKMGLNYINEKFKVKNDDIILTHDAARIFVSTDIINKNICFAKKYQSVDTVVPAIDTIVYSLEGNKIDSIPIRDNLYNSQTPQTFKLEILNNIYNNNYEDTSDICTLAVKNGYDVHLVNGEYSNIKITTDFDLEIINILIKKNNL